MTTAGFVSGAVVFDVTELVDAGAESIFGAGVSDFGPAAQGVDASPPINMTAIRAVKVVKTLAFDFLDVFIILPG